MNKLTSPTLNLNEFIDIAQILVLDSYCYSFDVVLHTSIPSWSEYTGELNMCCKLARFTKVSSKY